MDDDKTVFTPRSQPAPEEDRTVVVRASALRVSVMRTSGELLIERTFSATFSVGRALDNTLVLDDPLVSRHHFEVRRDGNAWWVVNLQSRNGISVDGSIVPERTRLNFPATVALGGSDMRLRIDQIGLPRPGGQAGRDPVAPTSSMGSHSSDTEGARNPRSPLGEGKARENALDVATTQPHASGSEPARPTPSPGGEGLDSTRTRHSPATTTDTPQGVEPSITRSRNLSAQQLRQRLLADEEADDAGDYTRFVRRIIREDRTVRTRSYRKAIWVLAVLFTVSLGLGIRQYLALDHARQLALDMFYDIKALEVSLAQADINLQQSAATLEKTLDAIVGEKLRIDQEILRQQQEKLAAERKRMQAERQRLAGMKVKYEQYVNEVNALRLRFPTAAAYEEELIARVARGLGESELELPDGFSAEVRKYIAYWQGTSRLQTALTKATKGDLLNVVLAALLEQGLPAYFIYLPLQESNYDAGAIGPQTRFGIAKGAWQLLATTAREYGLETGPLADVPEYDSQDARFDFGQATGAGTRYLKRIYGTEAQASGLLVMASYNYGDTRVREMIRQMPDNPRDKNFWKFSQKFDLPRETHDYVFYIFAAAVIGEDPLHFGYTFAPPLNAAP